MEKRSIASVSIAGLLVLVLVVTSAPFVASGPEAPAAATSPPGLSVLSGTLDGGPIVGNSSPTFWGVNLNFPCTTCSASHPAALGPYVNTTPLTFFRAFVEGDSCNQTTNTEWSDSGTPSPGCGFNDSAFIHWCLSRVSPCESEFLLPGEINSTVVAVETVRYVEDVLHYHPTYWTIGAAPWDWTHYNEPWSTWKTTDDSRANASAYTAEVRDYVAAVRSVDPTIRVVADTGSWQALKTVASLTRYDASDLAGLSFFLYPGGRGFPGASLGDFYASLNQAGSGHVIEGNISSNLGEWRNAMTEYCASCASLPVFIDQYNAALNASPYDSELASYPDAVYLAASVTQALKENVTALTFMHLQGAGQTTPYNLVETNGTISPVGILYQQIFSQLAMGAVRNTTIASNLGATTFSVESQSRERASLLIVNTNLTTSLNLSMGETVEAGTIGTAISWAPGAGAPTNASGTLSGVYVVPPQGILLLNFPPVRSTGSYAVGGVVTDASSGTPLSGVDVSVSPTLSERTGNSGTFVFALPNGSYRISVNAPGYAPENGSLTVNGTPATQNFSLQSLTGPPGASPPIGPTLPRTAPGGSAMLLVLLLPGVAAVVVLGYLAYRRVRTRDAHRKSLERRATKRRRH